MNAGVLGREFEGVDAEIKNFVSEFGVEFCVFHKFEMICGALDYFF